MLNTNNDRVKILDGLRLVAILMVMLFHYYSRFYGDLYVYEMDTHRIFGFGYLGVELFFIISGFVITLTLKNCNSFSEFIKKRFIRLIPGMLTCSVITFLIFYLVKPEFFQFSSEFKNLLISNSFISPNLINNSFGTNFSYIDGAYWSLWVELSFYFIISILYFINKQTFVKNFTILAVTGVLLYHSVNAITPDSWIGSLAGTNLLAELKNFVGIFLFLKYALWFLAGIYLLEIYSNQADKKSLLMLTLVLILQTVLMQNKIEILFCIIVYPTLLLFIYKPQYLSFLSTKFISKLGVASYSIYLIHQNAGVLLINKLSGVLQGYNILAGLLAIVLFCSFGLVSYKYIESKLGKYLLHKYIKKNKSSTAKPLAATALTAMA